LIFGFWEFSAGHVDAEFVVADEEVPVPVEVAEWGEVGEAAGAQ
jgi:hypothetical protein